MSSAETLVYDASKAGAPLQLLHHATPPTFDGLDNDGHVVVKFLAVPINRVDLLVLSGQYPTKPIFNVDGHPIPGFDGCGVVVQSSSPRFAPGDVVIPRALGLGTWRTHAVVPADSLTRLPRETPPLAGSLLRAAALVAWLLAEEVTPLQAGDWVVLSAGTSTVAQFFVQFARNKGVNAALIIRDRENSEATVKRLLELGAAKVLTEFELSTQVEKDGGDVLPGKVVLAIDSVFGRVGQSIAEVLSPGGKFVLMGLLGGPAGSISVTTKHLFYKQLSFSSFRSSEIIKRIGEANTEDLLNKLAFLMIQGSIKCPEVHVVNWSQGQGDHKARQGVIQESLEYAKSKDVGHQKVVWLLS